MRPRYFHIFFLLFVGSLFTSTFLYSQDFSNKGKDFWVGYGSHLNMYENNSTNNINYPNGSINKRTGGSQEMVLYFTSDQDANVTIEIPLLGGGGWKKTYKVLADQVTTSDVIPKLGIYDARLAEEGISDNGIHITSDVGIIAYAHIYNGSVSGASLLFPVTTLAREYYSLNYTQVSNSPYSFCYTYVVATEDNTNIEIILSANSKYRNKGDTIKVQLNKGQIYNVFGKEKTTTTGEDLSGTKIRSVATSTSTCKKIAVFSGSGKINIRCGTSGQSSADNYIQQAFPSNAWGRKYLTAPTYKMPNNFFRVAVSDPTTTVKVNGVSLSKALLVNNFYYEYSSNTPDLIESDKPVMVAQYITSSGSCGNSNFTIPGQPNSSTQNNGDPEMIYLSPIEQTIQKVTINSTPNAAIYGHYINIIIPKNGILSIDGVKQIGFTTHPSDNNYNYLQFNFLNAGSHTIISDSGFNAIAYGYGGAETYGYNAGTNVIDLDQKLSVNNPLGVIQMPATCKGTPVKLSITLPYIPLILKWIIPGAIDTIIDNSPSFDSTYVSLSGKTIYRFTLNQKVIFNTVGTFSIQVIVNNPTADGCSGEQQLDFDITVYGPPNVENQVKSTHCISDFIYMNDQSSITKDDRKIISYNWDTGDGIFHNAQNYSILPNRTGKYVIKYFVITDIGCLSDTIIKEVFIDSVPKVNFIIPDVTCINKDIIFKDATLSSITSNFEKWVWNFGDFSKEDTLLTNANITHVFDTLKNYTVKLSVITENGCLSSKQQTFSNNPNPVVGFVLPEICLEDAYAQFMDTTKIEGTVNGFTYKWNFGDAGNIRYSNTDIVPNPKHRYLTPGDYNVILQVNSMAGCVGFDTSAFTVNGSIPKAGLKVVNEAALCSNKEVEIVNNSKVDIGSVGKLIIFWDFDGDLNDTSIDENPIIGKSYKHLYKNFQFPNKMNFTIKLMAYSGGSCVDDSLTSITIVPPPQNVSTITSKDYVCLFDTLNVKAKVIGGVPPFVNTWSTSNGNANFTGDTLHGITAGRIDISLKMVDPKQCVYTFDNLKNMEVSAIPTAILSASDTVICNGDKVTLKGTGSSYFKWILNNAQIYESSVDTLATDLIGYYKLIVNDGKCNSLASDSILLKPLNIPVYTIQYKPIICTNTPLQIQTDALDKSFVHFVWDFGDSTSYAKADPISHSYKKSGTYMVKLKITNDYCKKYEYQLIGDSIKVIDPVSPTNFTLFILADVDSLFSPFKKDSGYTIYRWNPMTYLSDAFIPTPLFRSNKSIEYTLSRIDPITSCKVDDMYKIEVSPDVIVAVPKAFTPNGDNLNDILKLINGAGLKQFNSIKIFNRFGKIVYMSTNLSEGWDGKFNGIDQEMDAYTYLIDYITYKDEHITKTGSVILLR